MSKEEWKGMARDKQNPGHGRGLRLCCDSVDGFCVRVGAMRCHSQALTFKLKKDMPVADIQAMIAEDNEWVKVVPNTRRATIIKGPHACEAVTGTMQIPVGGASASWPWDRNTSAFTVGDQLLWGAAEPCAACCASC